MDDRSAPLVQSHLIIPQTQWTATLCSSDLIHHSSWLSYCFYKLTQSNGLVWCLSCVGYWGKKVNIKLFLSFEELYYSMWRRQTPKQDITFCYRESVSTGYRATQRQYSFSSTPPFLITACTTHYVKTWCSWLTVCRSCTLRFTFCFFPVLVMGLYWIIYLHFLGQFILTYDMYLLMEETHVVCECGAMFFLWK